MSGKGWIFALVGAGVVIAIVLGLLGRSQTVAEKRFCNSLAGLQSSVQSLTSLSPSTASQGDFQAGVSRIQNSWNDVKSKAQNLSSSNVNALDDSWNAFTSAVKSIPSSASLSDAGQAVSGAAKELRSTVQSNLKSYDCSNS